MNEVKIFESPEFGQVRTVTIDDEPWFVGKDVAGILKYGNTRDAISKRVDEDDKLRGVAICDPIGRTQTPILINESGLYSLILSSKLPSAKKFKRWVTSEVLPSIRKNGSYQQKPMSALEQLSLTQQAVLEVDEKVRNVEADLKDFKESLPILGLECQQITNAKNRKAVGLLGGKKSNAYHDKSIRGKVYSDLNGQLLREFGISTYKELKRSQCDKAIEIIETYELPLYLEEAIQECNDTDYRDLAMA